ncbi:MAG: hypothetical protein AAF728_01330 [Cyanobacteria bacterium P01_D01_bin.128]
MLCSKAIAGFRWYVTRLVRHYNIGHKGNPKAFDFEILQYPLPELVRSASRKSLS